MELVKIDAEASRVLAAGSCRWAQLGLPFGSSFAELKARYRKLTALHPDRNPGNALAAEAFALVSAAYQELSAVVAPAAASVPLHGSQPEAPVGNRWQAFTTQQHYKPAAAPAAAAPAAAQHPHGSQENRTPGSGGWGQPARWGRQGFGVVRVQPLAPGNAATGHGPGSAAKPAEQQQRLSTGGQHGRRGSQDAASDSSSGSDGGSSDSDSDDERSTAPSGGGIRPVAFYSSGGGGSGGRRRVSSPHPAAPAAAPPVVSLYGTFGARRSSGGYAVPSGWLGARPSAPAAAPQQQQQQQASLWGPQRSSWPGAPTQAALQGPDQQVSPAPQDAGPSQEEQQPAHVGAVPVSSRWGARSRAEVLRVPVLPAALAAEAAVQSASQQPQQQQEQQQQQERRQPPKRQKVVLSSSSSSEGASEGASEDSGDGSSDDEDGFLAQPSAAALAREQLTQAVLQQAAATRLAAQAVGAGFIQRGRDKALQRHRRKKRAKQSKAAVGGAKAAGGSGKAARGSGKSAGSGKAAAGSGKLQSKLKLTAVVRSAAVAPLVQHEQVEAA